MKTQFLLLALLATVFATEIKGQNNNSVYATNSEISDHLDLRVVSSIFGDSRDLQDFERRLNDPRLQISNLDLNFDGQVDYLRVIETIQKRTHVVIIQSVLNRDVFQDIATIEINKDWLNNIHIQVVGNSYFYGQNYIYEPIYYQNPIIYTHFWRPNYNVYCSNWNWNYYPNHYYSWSVYPLFRYRYNVNICLNNYTNNRYHYVSQRRSSNYTGSYSNWRANAFEKQHPEYSFAKRNANVSNRYDLDRVRNSSSRNVVEYSQRRVEANPNSRSLNQRDYSENSATPAPEVLGRRDYSQKKEDSQRETISRRANTQSRMESQNVSTPQRTYSQNKVEASRQSATTRQNPSSRYSSSTEVTTVSRNSNRRT